MIGLRYDQKMWEWLSLIIASQSGTGMSWPQLQCLSQWKLIVLTRLKKMCGWCGRVWGCMMYCDSCGVCGVMVTTAHLIMITQVETLVTGHTDHVNLDQQHTAGAKNSNLSVAWRERTSAWPETINFYNLTSWNTVLYTWGQWLHQTMGQWLQWK